MSQLLERMECDVRRRNARAKSTIDAGDWGDVLTETLQHKLAVLLAKYSLRADRGTGLLGRFIDPIRDFFEGTVYLFAIKGFFGVAIEPYIIVIIIIIKKALEYLLGWFDQKYGYWMIQNSYGTFNLNPDMNGMKEKIDEIHKVICK